MKESPHHSSRIPTTDSGAATSSPPKITKNHITIECETVPKIHGLLKRCRSLFVLLVPIYSCYITFSTSIGYCTLFPLRKTYIIVIHITGNVSMYNYYLFLYKNGFEAPFVLYFKGISLFLNSAMWSFAGTPSNAIRSSLY